MSVATSAAPETARPHEVGELDATVIDELLAALEEQARLTAQLAARVVALGDRLSIPHRLLHVGSPAAEAPAAPPALVPAHRQTAAVGRDAARDVAAAPEARVQMRLFGTFTLRVDGERVDGWRSGKARALLQYLATHHGRTVSRDSLVAELWPNPDAAAAGTSLKVAVHALRQVLARLGRDGAGGPGEPAVLAVLAHDAGYQLAARDLWLDVDEFERCCATGRRLEAQGRWAEALSLYVRAADLYQGDFLSDCWDDWVVFRREGLKDQYLFVVARLADEALAAGDNQGCIVYCQQLLFHDRCREDTYRTLMLCHARLGQRDRVRCWFELCARTLRSELGMGPEGATVDLYRRSMGHEAEGGLTLP